MKPGAKDIPTCHVGLSLSAMRHECRNDSLRRDHHHPESEKTRETETNKQASRELNWTWEGDFIKVQYIN